MRDRMRTRHAWRIVTCLGSVCVAAFVTAGQDVPAYRNSTLPVELRVGDLLSRMTLDEKVAQLEGTWQNPAFATDQKSARVTVSATSV